MPNALARETSPYLLQHRDNPVDWLPWGEEALRRAREHDRPLLVSIGYSACHWCHVMERESFEDPQTAALMNEHFVCVKVDREERPDVDALYMEAVQAMTGHGGWPLNVFVTPEQVPFFGGTYFPPEPRQGMPSWRQVLGAVAEAWQTRNDEIRDQGERMAAAPAGRRAARALGRAVRRGGARRGGRRAAVDASTASTAAGAARRSSRRRRRSSSSCGAASGRCRSTRCDRWPRAGMYDQVGGGFARYTVDATWTVPHFEKMLYDNALLARAYLHGWQVSGDDAAAAHGRGDARLGAARDARARGRLLQRARRRLRGRRGQVLRVDARRAARRARRRRRRRDRLVRRDRSTATSRARTSSSRAAPSRRPRCARGSARGCSRCAPRACGPASTTSASPPGTR